MKRPRSRRTGSAIRGDAPPSRAAVAETLVFRASLGPRIYRVFEVAETCTLYVLAQTITAFFDFAFDHAFGFYSNMKGNIFASPVRYELFADIGEGDEGSLGVEKIRASHAFPSPKAKMRFLFDYGDEWEFVVELVERKASGPKGKLPRLLISKGRAPEQYPTYDGDWKE